MKYRSLFTKIIATGLTVSFLMAGDTAFTAPAYAEPVKDGIEFSQEAEGRDLPSEESGDQVTLQADGEQALLQDGSIITGFDMPEETRKHFEYKFYLGSLIAGFPQTVTVFHDGTEDVINVSWKCEDDYDEDLDEYTFVPDLTGYTVADGCIIPCIIVTFDEEDAPQIAGYVEDDIDYEVPSVETTAEFGPDFDTAESLPDSYNKFDDATILPKGLPVVRNQYPYGTCWAFSTIGSIEADLIHDGTDISPDLSELHLAYYMFHKYEDPKRCRKDYVEPEDNDPKTWLDFGGNTVYAVRLLSNLVGAIPESDAPYATATLFVPSPGVRERLAVSTLLRRAMDAARMCLSTAKRSEQATTIESPTVGATTSDSL